MIIITIVCTLLCVCFIYIIYIVTREFKTYKFIANFHWQKNTHLIIVIIIIILCTAICFVSYSLHIIFMFEAIQ